MRAGEEGATMIRLSFAQERCELSVKFSKYQRSTQANQGTPYHAFPILVSTSAICGSSLSYSSTARITPNGRLSAHLRQI